MLGGIPVELQQRIEVVGDLGDRLGVLGAVVEFKGLGRDLGPVYVLSVVDILERGRRARVGRLRQCGKNIGLLMKLMPMSA